MGVKSNSPQEIYFGSFDSTEGSGIGLDPIPPVPFTATGGTITTPGNGFKYHLFTTSGSFVGTGDPVSGAEVLVVAGGGGGGSYYGGGGGGGGVVHASGVTFSAGTYPVVIGTGGPGGSPGVQAPDGVNSTFGNPTPGPSYYLLAEGGGGGGGTYYGANASGRSGGCGGGSGGGDPPPANGQATQPGTNSSTPVYPAVTDYGQPGGFSVPAGGYGTAGGGGSSSAGGNCPGNISGGGDGGNGHPFPSFPYSLTGKTPAPQDNSPSFTHYAGGGGGRLYGGTGPAGSGAPGYGGGGRGQAGGAPAAINAVDGLGGGGGGTHPGGGGAGGDGVVIVLYPVT